MLLSGVTSKNDNVPEIFDCTNDEEVLAKAFCKMGLKHGDRVAILLPNGVDAVCCDQAVLANGLVPVPLHAIDTAGSSAFIIADSQACVLVTNRQNRWDSIYLTHTVMPYLRDVIFTDESSSEARQDGVNHWDLESWLATGHGVTELPQGPAEDDLAAIVYTSGTTGKPKGVMLTHKNVVSNVINTLKTVCPKPDDVFLSFLPVSHTFERMAGYYLALGMGCTIVYTRSIQQLAEDFRIVRPNVIISVPRIYERIFAKVQAKLARESKFVRFLFNWAVEVGWRRFSQKYGLPCQRGGATVFDPIVWPILERLVSKTLLNQFGGQLRIAISGGAAMNPKVAKAFCGLGLPIIQGYGMTESSPIIAGNSLTYNHPSTVGKPLPETVPVHRSFSHRKASDIQYQSIPEVRLIVSDSQGFQSLQIRKEQITRISIIPLPVVLAEERLSRIFFGGQSGIHLFIVLETIAHIVIERVAIITLVRAFRQGFRIIIGIACLGVERDIQTC